MSDQSDGQVEGQAEAPESTPPEWLGPIEERMNDLRDQNFALAEQFQSLLEYDEDDEQYEEEQPEVEVEDEDGNLTPEGAEMLVRQIVQQQVAEDLGQHLGARDAAEMVDTRNMQYDLLREQYPDLQDDEYAGHIIRELAAELDAAGAGHLISHPRFVDLIEQRHKAYQFDEYAEQDPSLHRGNVVLESAGGAAPQQRDEEVDWADRVVQAAARSHPRI